MNVIPFSKKDAADRVHANDWKPRNAVWELTLACNLRCRHCGSRAGQARNKELTLDECLTVANDLADMGAELVTLSGGEPTLKKGWERIGETLTRRGVLVNMVTNGTYAQPDQASTIAQMIRNAGMCNVGISLDGDEKIHEWVRGEGTYAATLDSIARFAAAGVRVGVLTTVNIRNLPLLEQICQTAANAGATLWRVQLGKPMGAMSDEDIVIPPSQYMRLVDRLVALKRKGGIHVAVGDSIGYYGPPDKALRGTGWRNRAECWQGCQAGMQAIGIESDGGIKGCLSLQARMGAATDPFVEGNIRDISLKDLWYRPGVFSYNRDFTLGQLSGHCSACKYASLCRGGAKCVAASLGQLGEDPYCYYHLWNEMRRENRLAVTRSAGAAVAAMVLAVSAQACDLTKSDSKKKTGDVQADLAYMDVEPDPGYAPEYGVDPDWMAQPDNDAVVQPDAIPDIQEDEASSQPEYGVGLDVQQSDTLSDVLDEDASVYPEYGVQQDVVDADIPSDGIDCTNVCCECDYGILPEDVIKECCTPPDPCENVCCECEYGIIPEDLYKKCCAPPDPCENACCDCDYGEPPPPECCP
jgi:MoaA/NifB/PqqE/SkfB family radical SAM enzyme